MATVNVEINGRPYTVGCADGQEHRVRDLARQFDEHVRQVARDVGHVGDLRLFLMAALLVSDELAEARHQLAALRTHDANGKAAQALSKAAERIERLVQAV